MDMKMNLDDFIRSAHVEILPEVIKSAGARYDGNAEGEFNMNLFVQLYKEEFGRLFESKMNEKFSEIKNLRI